MSIYYLNAGDFGQENGHLIANIGGITMIMFHSDRCGHCKNFEPVFKQLSGSIRGINFGMCNVDGQNNVIVKMSKQSTTPINAVPKFILYNNGIPYVEYSGQRSRQAILGFLQEIITKLNQKQSFTRPRRTRQQPMPQQQPTYQQQQPGLPSRPQGTAPNQMPGGGGGGGNSQNYKITPNTGVKEYETSYGRPYNTLNEMDFLEYESAYKQQIAK